MKHELRVWMTIVAGAAFGAGASPAVAWGPGGSDRSGAIASVRNDSDQAASEVVRVLRESRDTPLDEYGELALQLEQTVPNALGMTVRILVDQRVPALDEGSAQVLSEPQTELLMGALGGASFQAVEAHVAQLAEQGESGHLDAAVRLLGATGGASDLSRICALALPEGEDLSPRVESAARWALERILRREPAALTLLPAIWRKMPVELTPALLEAVGEVGDARGLLLVDEVLGGEEYVDEAIAQIARFRLIDPARVSTRILVRVRADLAGTEATRIKGAIVALASLGDTESVPDLVSRLDSSDQGLRNTVHWGLCQLTGASLPPQREIWRHWLRTEVDWFERSRPALVDQIKNGRRAEIGAALREFSRHSLHRHRLAMEAALAAKGCDVKTALVLCSTLERLDSVSAAPVLLALLEDPDPSVEAAAVRALRSVTGLEHGANAEEWRLALEPML